MAVPANPTRSSLCIEGLQQAGYAASSPGWSTLLTRAQDNWMEEIKNEIWDKAKQLKSLQTWSVAVTTSGQARYPNPADYSSDMKVEILHGSTYGTAQAGTASNITLAATDTSTATAIVGMEIAIYEGTAEGSLSQIISYNETTKIAEVSPDFNTVPDSSSKYVLISFYKPLIQNHAISFDLITNKNVIGIPESYFPIGDDDTGEFILNPTPYHATIPFIMRMRYYANLMKLDIESTLMTTLYQRWRSLFIQGICFKSLKNKRDSAYKDEQTIYYQKLQILISREQYGVDLNDLQMKVYDY